MKPPSAPISERAFLRMILDLAHLRHWRAAHFRPARTAKGWRTAVQGFGKGFPDVIALREARTVVIELKAQKGRLTPEQEAWLTAFRATDAEVYVFRPSQWPEIEHVLE